MSSRKILSLVVVSAIGASCVSGRINPRVAAQPAAAGTCRSAAGPDSTPVTWSRPESAADRTQLDRWCQAVGPAIVASSPAPPDGRPRDLSVVSWNARVGGGDVIGFVGAIRRGQIAEVPADNDLVILLQEAFRSGDAVPSSPGAGALSAAAIRETPPSATLGGRVDVVAVARRLGLFLYYAPSMRNGAPAPGRANEDRGNAILSSLPLGDLRAIELPFERQRRVAIAATVGGVTSAGRRWQLRVVSAHLDNLAPRSLWIFASGARERQARGLIAALPGVGFSVVGSDLNTWAAGTREPAYLALRQSFPQTELPTYRSSAERGLLLDYMFWRVEGRPAPGVYRVNETYGSDHHPLATTVSLDDLVPQQLLSVSRSH